MLTFAPLRFIMLQRMTVTKQLICAFTVVTGVCIALGVSSLWSLSNLGNLLTVTATQTAAKLEFAGILVSDTAKLRSAQRGVIMYTGAGDAERVETNRKLFLTVDQDIRLTLATMQPLLEREEAVAAAQTITQAERTYVAAFSGIYSRCQAGDVKSALSLAREVAPLGDKMEAGARKISSIQHEMLTASVSHGREVKTRAEWLAATLLLVCGLAGVGVLLVVRRISRALQGVTTELREGSSQIAAAAGQIAASSQVLAGSASEQAASIEQTSAAGHEVSAMTDSNAQRSTTAAALMIEVSEHVSKSNTDMGDMRVSMAEIEAVAAKISGITKLVDGIAFQTNILALNAAVEAARAGEAGMGFAVVADEVRALAQRSAEAARSTAQLIQESLSASVAGSAKLAQVAQSIETITERASKARSLFDEVRSSTDQQRLGLQQIAIAMSHFEKATQATAAQAEEEAAASEELSAQVQTLDRAVVELAILIGAKS